MEKENQIEAIQNELRGQDGFYGMIGDSAVMRRVFSSIRNVADSDASVIIQRECTAGQELVAQAAHPISPQSDTPYVKVNRAALNESQLETEPLGLVKGASTGAHKKQQGRFEAANGGTFFLAEIRDLPLSTQVKLLRVIEEIEIEEVGDNMSIEVDVRIVTATNRDLEEMVRQELFREDVYFRLNVVPVQIPPLRDPIAYDHARGVFFSENEAQDQAQDK